MQILIIILPFVLLSINYLSVSILSVPIIFLLMRFYSAYISKASINTSTLFYIFYIPELVTGPFREYNDWNIDNKNKNSFSVSFIIILNNIIFILGSGYLYIKLLPFYDNLFYHSIITYITLYIQFSSMSNISNAFSSFIGKKEIINFNNPLMATSINDFWNRWHVSLGGFAKKYINQPLTFYLSKKIKIKNLPFILSILITFLFIGLWHNLSYSYLLFGAYFGIIVIIERLAPITIIKNERLQYILGIIYTQSTHLLGFSLVTEYIQKIIIHP